MATSYLSEARRNEIHRLATSLKSSMMETHFFTGHEVAVKPLNHSTVRRVIEDISTADNQAMISSILANDIFANLQNDASFSFARAKDSGSFLTPEGQSLFNELSGLVFKKIETFFNSGDTTNFSRTDLVAELEQVIADFEDNVNGNLNLPV